MKFTLIICTYKRPGPLKTLLESVVIQNPYPNAVLIIDGSPDENTELMLSANAFKNISYHRVPPEHRGLTKQRNYGIERVSEDQDIVCFLDDDIVLKEDYFKILLNTYLQYPKALGVGGYIANDITWMPVSPEYICSTKEFCYDGFARPDGSRFILRKKLGLDANRPPAHLPNFSHGRSVSFLPPSEKIYPVEQFMGGVSSFRQSVLKEQKFSEYFQGYGLYEDADYTLRLSQRGPLYVNTAAQLYHYHDPDGRPNQFTYGKMVIRNGWYVWRVQYPKPSVKARLKWNMTAGVLALVRLGNALKGDKKKQAFTESLGRIVGWWSLIFNRPKRK